MQQSHQVIVKIGLRPTYYPGDNPGNNEISNLADNNKGDCDPKGLQIDVRAKELGPTLNLQKDLLHEIARSISPD